MGLVGGNARAKDEEDLRLVDREYVVDVEAVPLGAGVDSRGDDEARIVVAVERLGDGHDRIRGDGDANLPGHALLRLQHGPAEVFAQLTD